MDVLACLGPGGLSILKVYSGPRYSVGLGSRLLFDDSCLQLASDDVIP